MSATVSNLGILDGPALGLGVALDPNAVVAGITADSREVSEGALFYALKGAKLDGARFIQYAAQGAVTALETMGGASPVPLIVVDDPRHHLAITASRLAGAQPDKIVAITGTSGKTSTADFLRQIWDLIGVKAASFGTTGVTAPGINLPGGLTTPDPVALHKLLGTLRDCGATHVAMEASSHGLDQRRLDGVNVAAAALTNVARDHMDYHPTSANYAAAKLRLFTDLTPEAATVAVNADDIVFPLVETIAQARGLTLLPIGEGDAAANGIRIGATRYDDAGQTVEITWTGDDYSVRLPLIGAFQARNVLTAAALAVGCGADRDTVIKALPELTGVRGRMEFVGRRTNGAAVYVDYAHKPDALIAALRGLRPHVEKRLHVVFGAGGDRDPGKRPLMGTAAVENAD
ncbi:UNVERIFIED_CONTAM: hypothetical protein GTU68_037179, partial [Idotea baltica]|nr:hypothetical protein [Idotea baltica]